MIPETSAEGKGDDNGDGVSNRIPALTRRTGWRLRRQQATAQETAHEVTTEGRSGGNGTARAGAMHRAAWMSFANRDGGALLS
ncbi:MAG: hypothetical protein GX131_00590 [candidate division WS1 bacterium]|jgi:hypothetical protein|nr:hypothetical protein [candidate division WS1 bacterium]